MDDDQIILGDDKVADPLADTDTDETANAEDLALDPDLLDDTVLDSNLEDWN